MPPPIDFQHFKHFGHFEHFAHFAHFKHSSPHARGHAGGGVTFIVTPLPGRGGRPPRPGAGKAMRGEE